MRFGLFGSAQAKRPEPGAELTDSSQGFREWIENNVEAEALGFHSTFVVEHHFTGFGQVSATLNLLTWIGARTTTLRLGTAVIVLPWHNPVLLAEQAATVDLLSGGRLDFGIGKGYRHNEYASFRVPMEEGQARFEEAIDIITKSWVSNERFDFHGRFWQYDGIVVEPPTIQKPHPRFWQGAGHPESIRRVARRGHNLLLDQFASLEETGNRFAVGKQLAVIVDAHRYVKSVFKHRTQCHAAAKRRKVGQITNDTRGIIRRPRKREADGDWLAASHRAL